MLNEREVVLHWHLRDVVTWLTVAVLGLLLMGMILAAAALAVNEALLWGVAGADVALAVALSLVLRRAWRRLEALERFIP